MSICEKCLEKIKQQNIKPTSKMYFACKKFFINISIPVILFFSLIFAVISVISFLDFDLDVLQKHRFSFWYYFFTNLPYLPIFFTLLLAFLAFILYRQTELGYKTERKKLMLTGIFILTIGTIIIFISKTAMHIENFMNENPYLMRTFQEHKIKTWTAPEKGLLSGKIIAVHSDNKLTVKDFDGKIWTIDIIIEKIPQGKRFLLREGNYLKFIGDTSSFTDIFQASEIKPWKHYED